MDLRHNFAGVIEGCKIVDGILGTYSVALDDARGNTSLESFKVFKVAEIPAGHKPLFSCTIQRNHF